MNSYLKKGGIAVVDQVLFSGSNFLLNIFLVKLLTPDDYGIFGSLYSLYLLFFVAFAAAFLEPYMYYKNTLENSVIYTKLYAGFSNNLVLFSVAITIVGIILHSTVLVYVSYTIVTCNIYFYKRHFFSVLMPVKSLYISIVYFLLMVIGLTALNLYPEKNLFNAFLILNFVSIISLTPTVLFTKEFKHLIYTRKALLELMQILKRQKKFSFHCLSSSILSWIPNNIYFVLIPIFFSNEINAQFKALQNINLPLYHFNIAVVSMLLPVFIKSTNPVKVVKQVSIVFIMLPMIYLISILYLLRPIEHHIYDDKYVLQPFLIVMLVTGLIFEILSNIYKSYFRSIEKPEIVTKINLLNVVISLLFIYVVYKFGLTGVIFSYFLNNIFNFFNSFYFFYLDIKGSNKVRRLILNTPVYDEVL